MYEPGWVEAVRKFWFDELKPEQWFEQSDEVDETIRRRFGALYESLKVAPPEEARTDAATALSAIIALDQFPRNLFRGNAEAFGTDGLAVDLARNAVNKGLDRPLSDREKRFMYMPLMHSEVLADQERCLFLFKSLDIPDIVKYAVEHRDLIARFGRFPHRNKILGRKSTPEEETYLETGKTFGQ